MREALVAREVVEVVSVHYTASNVVVLGSKVKVRGDGEAVSFYCVAGRGTNVEMHQNDHQHAHAYLIVLIRDTSKLGSQYKLYG